MSYSRDPSFYPPEFQEVFQRALLNDSDIVVECDSHMEATNLRHQFHAYRRAVEINQLAGWTELRKIVIKLDKKKIIFSNNERLMERLREAVGQKEPTPKDIDEYLRQMEKGDGK